MKPERIVKLKAHLAEIPELYGNLPAIDEMVSGGGSGESHSGKTTGSAAPLNLEVVHLADQRFKRGWREHNPGQVATIERFGTLPALMWWTEYFADRMLQVPGVKVPAQADPATVGSECSWLAEAIMWILTNEWAPVFASDMERLHTRLSAANGVRLFVPHCGTCDSVLEERDSGNWYRCPDRQCGRTYTQSSGLGELGRRQPPIPGKQIAALLQIPWSTLRKWDERGVITAARRDSRGRKLYHLADVKRARERVAD